MIRAAAKLIARQGYTRTSLAQVGEESGYTGGLVSHHFGSKEGLLRQLVSHISERFYDDQIRQATEGRSGLEALCACAGAYLRELVLREERIRALYVLMGESLGPVAEIRPVFAELNRSFRATARAWIEEGIAQRTIRAEVDPDAEASLFVGMLRGVAMQWMAEPGCFDLDPVAAGLDRAGRSHLAARAAPR